MQKLTYAKFAEHLRGYSVIGRSGVIYPKWFLYHNYEAHEVWDICQKRHEGFIFVNKPGWKNGVMVPLVEA